MGRKSFIKPTEIVELEKRIGMLEKKVATLEGQIQEQQKLNHDLIINVSDGNTNDLVKKHSQMLEVNSPSIGI